jgi:predicted enzyme related to lactoylglutathione lyase
MDLGYLEFVTANVDAVCATYEAVHGVTFSAPVPALGHARVAATSSGGRLGVRAPLRPDETPVVRPYVLVDDVEAAVAAAAAAGAEVAMPAMTIPGQGTFAIFLQDGIESGLWQRE